MLRTLCIIVMLSAAGLAGCVVDEPVTTAYGALLMLMTPPSFVEVGTQDPPENGEASVVTVDGVAVALFNLDGQIYALSDFCVRCGASLALGMVVGTHVSCRQCTWRYDIVSGRLTELPALATDRFEVKINDGHMVVATEPSAIGSR